MSTWTIRDAVIDVIGWAGLWAVVAGSVSGVALILLGAIKLLGVLSWSWLWLAAPVAVCGAVAAISAMAGFVYITLGRVPNK